jgi:hypothetical protein
MDIKDRSAFPVMDSDYKCGMAVLTCVDSGVTALELIACNAPVDIPSWFVHTKPNIEVSAAPEWINVESKADQEHLKQWVRDGEYELPDHLMWFKEQYEKHAQERHAFFVADMQARYFQWRRFYAENLLSELSK